MGPRARRARKVRDTGAIGHREHQSAEASSVHDKSPRRIWKIVAATALSIVAFLFTPFGEDLRLRGYSVVYPKFNRAVNEVAHRAGLTPVQTLNTAVLNQNSLVLTTPVVEGEPAPTGICDNGDWTKLKGAAATGNRIYVEILTGRSDVFLSNATLDFTPRPSEGKALAFCNDGGNPGDATVFFYQTSEDGATTLAVSGNGAK